MDFVASPSNPQTGSTAVTVTLHTCPLGSHPQQVSRFISVLMLFPMLLQFPQESLDTDIEVCPIALNVLLWIFHETVKVFTVPTVLITRCSVGELGIAVQLINICSTIMHKYTRDLGMHAVSLQLHYIYLHCVNIHCWCIIYTIDYMCIYCHYTCIPSILSGTS